MNENLAHKETPFLSVPGNFFFRIIHLKTSKILVLKTKIRTGNEISVSNSHFGNKFVTNFLRLTKIKIDISTNFLTEDRSQTRSFLF